MSCDAALQRRANDPMGMRTSLAFTLFSGACLVAGVSSAQPGATRELTLAEAVATTLERSPDIELGRLTVVESAAARRFAAHPFDLRVQTSLDSARENLPLYGQGTLLPSDTLTTGASLEKTFRSGMVVFSEVSVGRLAHGAIPTPANHANSSLSVVLPLAGGRGGGAAAGAERAAERSYDASRLDRDHTSARAVRSAVVTYWQYVGADERLQIYRDAETSAERLLAETEALIGADERPASDRDLMAGNLASAQAVRVAAEQTLVEARYALGLAMGLAADAIPSLGAPVTPFPQSQEVTGGEAIVRTALAARRDLAAARARRTGARLAWEGAVGDLRPRWDIVGGIGHVAISSTPPEGDFLSPLPGSATGLNASVQIRYVPVTTNSAVRGAALRADVAHRVAIVIADDLARRIRAEARVAAEALDSAERETAIAEDALRLSRRAVETEREKFRLGLATVFDAILAEETLTRALLRRTHARLRYALALARLRFEAGTLLEVAHESVSGDPDAALHFVLPEQEPQ